MHNDMRNHMHIMNILLACYAYDYAYDVHIMCMLCIMCTLCAHYGHVMHNVPIICIII